ncbi:MAG: Ig-like domain-containing protein [Velocimicrobium sp.]
MKKLTRVICVVVFCLVATMGMSNVSDAAEVQYTDNVIPVMTSDTAPSGKASASSLFSSNFSAYEAFNHTCNGNGDAWNSVDGQPYGWLEYDFSEPKCISKYAIVPRNPVWSITELPKTWTFEAWNDTSSEWIILDSRNSVTNWVSETKKEFTFSNSTYYSKYRINIKANNGLSNVSIGELEMMEVDNNKVSKKLKVVIEPTEKLQLSVSEDLDDNAKLVWTSSDETVATVDSSGEVTAIKTGDSVITVKEAGGTYTENINILVVDDADDYRLAVDLKVGKYCRLTVDDYTNTEKVTWTSMDPAIATVSSKGKVKAVSEGLTIVAATDVDGNEIGQVYVRVRI